MNESNVDIEERIRQYYKEDSEDLKYVDNCIKIVENNLEGLKKYSSNFNKRGLEKESFECIAEVSGIDYGSTSESTTPSFSKNSVVENIVTGAEENINNDIESCIEEIRILCSEKKDLLEKMIKISSALDILDKESRTIIELYFKNKLSFEKIGERLNLARQSVSKKLKEIILNIEKTVNRLSNKRIKNSII